jgi:hypothetical protein
VAGRKAPFVERKGHLLPDIIKVGAALFQLGDAQFLLFYFILVGGLFLCDSKRGLERERGQPSRETEGEG